MSIETYLRFVLALILVVGLILVLAWIARRSGFGPANVKPLGRSKRRLGIVETLTLDPKRRLVIVRRDATEHLILLGTAGETVVEHGLSAPEAFALPDAEVTA